jgi:peptidoglycan hydrolase CwlO-like protein
MLNFLKNNVKEIVIGVFLLVIIVLGYFLFDTLQTVNKMTDPFNDAKELLEKRLEESDEALYEIKEERDELLKQRRKADKELDRILNSTEATREQIELLKKEIKELNRIDNINKELSINEFTEFVNKILLEKK